MDRRHFIKSMLILAGGAALPVSALSAKSWKAKIWGQKSLLPGRGVLRRIHVKRLVLFIESGVKKIMLSHLYEPIDQITRDSMIGMTNSFCLNIKQTGSRLYDYKTICDQSNNTPEMVNRKEVFLDLYLKFSPAPGEEVKISFHLNPVFFDTTKKVI